MKTANLPNGFVLVTQLRVMEPERNSNAIATQNERKEEPVYEPERSDVWVWIGLLAVAVQFAAFYIWGVYKALESVLQKVGLGG